MQSTHGQAVAPETMHGHQLNTCQLQQLAHTDALLVGSETAADSEQSLIPIGKRRWFDDDVGTQLLCPIALPRLYSSGIFTTPGSLMSAPLKPDGLSS